MMSPALAKWRKENWLLNDDAVNRNRELLNEKYCGGQLKAINLGRFKDDPVAQHYKLCDISTICIRLIAQKPTKCVSHSSLAAINAENINFGKYSICFAFNVGIYGDAFSFKAFSFRSRSFFCVFMAFDLGLHRSNRNVESVPHLFRWKGILSQYSSFDHWVWTIWVCPFRHITFCQARTQNGSWLHVSLLSHRHSAVSFSLHWCCRNIH